MRTILRQIRSYRRVLLRWFKHFGKSLLDEFPLSDRPFGAAVFVSFVLRYTKLLSLILGVYVLLRYTFINTVFTKEEVLKSIRFANHDGWFEIIYLTLLSGIVLTTSVRLVKPIRFASTAHWICFCGFSLYALEKYYLGSFEFFSSSVTGIDYLSILALPGTIEVILRTTYALRRRKLRNNSLLIENQSIENDLEDRTTRSITTGLIARHLNYSYFQHSYSIGVVGDWGVGKTSFFKSLLSKIDNAILIQFNPWLSTGRNSLLQEFIESLKDELGQYDKSITFELDNYLNSIIEFEGQTKTNFGKIFQKATMNRHSSSAELRQVRRSIERIGKRIIIVIDDLDRLTKEEIIDVLKLIRNTGDFSNTVYISCYDKVYLLHALQSFSKRNLNILLDKFFDLEIPLSPFPSNVLLNYLRDNFFKPFSIPTEHMESILNSIKSDTFRQLREMKKFISSLSLNYVLYGRTLHFHDFFFLEILKVRYPFLPDILWRDQDKIFCKKGEPEVLALFGSEPEELQHGFQTQFHWYLASNERDEFSRTFLSADDQRFIMQMMELLFPGKPFGAPYAIQEPNFFPNYFYHSIPDSATGIANWFTAIQKGTYLTDAFFNDPHDIKKENAIIDALFVSPSQFISAFKPQPAIIVDFLVHLIDWSGGRLALSTFIKTFQLLELRNPKSTFSKALVSDKLSGMQCDARANFIAIVLRSFIMNKDFSLEFADVNQLKIDNQRIFSAYLETLSEITNETFSVFFHQLDSIDRITNRVALTKASTDSFRIAINRDPVSFLDLIIRGAIAPNHTLEFTFAPFIINSVFGAKDELESFVNATDYAIYRKAKLAQYIRDAIFDEKYYRYVFSIKEEELNTLPYEFHNAWALIPQDIKNRVKETDYTFKTHLTAQPAIPGNEKARDHILNQIFEINEGLMRIVLTPKEGTKFWRFGIKFSSSKEFPKTLVPRHDSDHPDIAITVGQRVKGGRWAEEDVLTWEEIHLSAQRNTPKSNPIYRGKPVFLNIYLTKVPTTYLVMEVLEDSQLRGVRGYELNNLQYFRLSAWCDEHPFSLDLEVNSKMRVDGQVVDARTIALKSSLT